MRMLTRTIHRAFPELDAYDDDQCARFIRAARNNTWVVLFHTLAILTTVLPLLVIGLFGALWLSDRWKVFEFTGFTDIFTLSLLLWLPTGGLMLLVGPIAGYIVRDLLLRQRLKYVLRKRGGCPGCGYSVVGLRVSVLLNGATVVRCPECGVEVEVDASLSELERHAAPTAVGETGRVFVDGKKVDLFRFWTPARTRRIKRFALLAAIVIFGGGGLVLGINEILTRAAASSARHDLQDAKTDLGILAASMQSAIDQRPADHAASGINAWQLFDQADALISRADAPAWLDAVTAGTPRAVQPDFSFLEYPETIDPVDRPVWSVRANRASAELAARMIADYHAAGAFDALALAGSTTSTLRPASDYISGPFSGNVDSLRMLMVQRLIRINAGRAALAAQAGNKAEFIASTDAFLAIARACAAQPTFSEQEVALVSEAAACRAIRRWLLSPNTDPSWLPDIEASLVKGRVNFRHDLAIKGDHLLTRCTVDLFFTEPDHFRFGRFSGECQSLFRGIVGLGTPGQPAIRLGTLSENRTQLANHYDAIAPLYVLDPFERPPLPPTSPGFASLGLLKLWTSRPSFTAIDEGAAERRGLALWLAIERFKSKTGAYPTTLAELAPTWIAEIPLDPWTGVPPRFRRVNPVADPHSRSFLLYFVGQDGIDDGGEGVTSGPNGWFPGSSSRDLVVNDPKR